MTGENGPEMDGWQVQPPKHCGEWCFERDCPVCGVTLPMPLCELGEN